ncbi:hypothetical protein SEA_ANON_84 [Gordonia phage Anon]|nr:hypothetical protein SEA_ANON_84 [Gordonia phage Anon]
MYRLIFPDGTYVNKGPEAFQYAMSLHPNNKPVAIIALELAEVQWADSDAMDVVCSTLDLEE